MSPGRLVSYNPLCDQMNPQEMTINSFEIHLLKLKNPLSANKSKSVLKGMEDSFQWTGLIPIGE